MPAGPVMWCTTPRLLSGKARRELVFRYASSILMSVL
jgi:hypothetical protein